MRIMRIMRIIGLETKAMRRKTTGWFFTATGFLACPCHLVITLPLAMAVLSGTALGGWIGTHEGAVTLGATLYFVGALTLGATLLLARTRPSSQARLASPASPASQAAQQACNPACEGDSTRSRDGTRTTPAGSASAPLAEVR